MAYHNPLILMYHSIANEPLPKLKGLRVSIKTFEKQVAYLAKHGYHSLTLAEMIERKNDIPPKTVVITFDDGYKDNLTNALPILQKYNFKATLFLVIERENNDWAKYRKQSNQGVIHTIEKLSNNDVTKLLQSGLIEIGAHTLHHYNFQELSVEAKKEEIARSKESIEKNFGVPCKTFSYPFGLFTKDDDTLVQDAGFIGAVTTERRSVHLNKDSLYLLPRIAIKNEFLKFIYKLYRL